MAIFSQHTITSLAGKNEANTVIPPLLSAQKVRAEFFGTTYLWRFAPGGISTGNVGLLVRTVSFLNFDPDGFIGF